MEVIVPDDQQSLAIGKKGQNVRLASRLTGWRLDVRSESEMELERARALESLTAVPGIGDIDAEFLYQSGFKTAEEVAQADLDALLDVEGIGEEKAPVILQAARDYVASKAAAAAEALPVEPAAAEETTGTVQE